MYVVGRPTSCTQLNRTTMSSEISVSRVSHIAEFVCSFSFPETDILSLETVSHMFETHVLSDGMRLFLR
jgi:hypothetical protein